MNFHPLVVHKRVHIGALGWTWATCVDWKLFEKLPKARCPRSINRGRIPHYLFKNSTSILGMFFCHKFVPLFICNKILLDYFFTHVVFLFFFFLSHDLNLELGLPLFSFWLGNLVVLVVFMLMIIIIYPKNLFMFTITKFTCSQFTVTSSPLMFTHSLDSYINKNVVPSQNLIHIIIPWRHSYLLGGSFPNLLICTLLNTKFYPIHQVLILLLVFVICEFEKSIPCKL